MPRDDVRDDGPGEATKAEPGGSHPDAGPPEAEIPDPQGELEFWSQGCDDDSRDGSGGNDPGSEPSPAAGEVREDKADGKGAALDVAALPEMPPEDAGAERTDRLAAVDGETPGSAEPAGSASQTPVPARSTAREWF